MTLALLHDAAAPIDGTLYALFQPAEEVGRGMAACLADPRMAALPIDMAFALHNLPGAAQGTLVLPRGNAAAASTGMRIRLEGRRAHASEPHLARNPIHVLADLASIIQQVPTRLPFGHAGLATLVGIHAGEGAFGSSPDVGTLESVLRADRQDDLDAMIAHVEEQARSRAQAAELKRPVELLVNNASEFPSTSAENATWEALEASVRVHHWAPLLLTRALADQAIPASVVNILDSTRPEHDLDHFAYQAGKNALASLTRVTAAALAPTVRVNAVAPGAILQPAGEDPAILDEIARGLPLHRHGSPQDVANAVLYLATAPFVTGVTLRVDGGAHLLGGRDP